MGVFQNLSYLPFYKKKTKEKEETKQNITTDISVFYRKI
jgi:hypothetical protein